MLGGYPCRAGTKLSLPRGRETQPFRFSRFHHRVLAGEQRKRPKGVTMGTQEAGNITGTKDKDYNVIWFVEQCLSNVLRLETYIQDAERDGDSELADFFRRAQEASRKGGEQGKALLTKRLAS
jgi:hypothetical protein